MTDTSIKIHPATAVDLLSLMKISTDTFCETYASHNTQEDMDKYVEENFSFEQVKTEFEAADNKFFLAFSENIPVGYVKLRLGETPEELKGKINIEIERIYVLKSYQKKKVGAALMDYCIRYAREHHFEVIWLGVWEKNLKALQFYQNWGFEKFGTKIFVLGTDRQNDLLMKKELA